VDTEVSEFYSDNELISAPSPGDPFFGQDATYLGNSPSYTEPGDGTIIDQVTGLFWEKNMGQKISYSEALIKADTLTAGGYDDWRLPNAKELQSLLDYTRSPQTTGSPAIDSLFETTEILDPDGNPGQYPYFWTGTTHQDGPNPYSSAVYIAFGEAQGKMNDRLMDVHGAGSQRSDPRSGELSDYPQFHGPQGDVRYVFNAVRCVRDISQLGTWSGTSTEGNNLSAYPNPTKDHCMIRTSGDVFTYEWKLFDPSALKIIKQ
jgi:hypothetical protein